MPPRMSGQCVLVPRAREQASELCTRLESLGARTIAQPAIIISEPANWGPVDQAIKHLAEFDWVIFSSTNGVRYFCERLSGILGKSGQSTLRSCHIAAIGPSTADMLRKEFELPVDFVPVKYRAEELAEGLVSEATVGKRFLLVRASRGRAILADQLRKAGGVVTEVIAYSSEDARPDDLEVLRTKRQILDGQVDWIVVTSSAIANSVTTMYGDALRYVRIASISPVTSQTLRKLGFEPIVEATVYTISGIINAMAGENG